MTWTISWAGGAGQSKSRLLYDWVSWWAISGWRLLGFLIGDWQEQARWMGGVERTVVRVPGGSGVGVTGGPSTADWLLTSSGKVVVGSK